MARVCSVIATSHSPFLYADPAEWEPGRATRLARGGMSPDTKVDTVEENLKKGARIKAAFGVLKEHLEAAKPDVLLIFGDDQLEQFNFKNFPALSLFTGDSFEGYKISRMIGLPVMPGRKERDKSPANLGARPKQHRLLTRPVARTDERRLRLGVQQRAFRIPTKAWGTPLCVHCTTSIPSTNSRWCRSR